MPILAECPYCHEGKVRAPDRAIGLSATCPRCHNSFTIVASSLRAPEKPSANAMASKPTAAPAGIAAAAAGPSASAAAALAKPGEEEVTETPPAAQATPLPPMPAPTSYVAPRPRPEPVLPVALVAMILAGISMAASQIPFSYARLATAMLALFGLLIGGGSLLFAERSRVVPAISAALNLIAILLAVVFPNWLGLRTWLPEETDGNTGVVLALNHDGSAPAPAEWVDVSRASWQQDDVRVTMSSATLGPIELTGPDGKKKFTKEKYLQIWVRIANAGVARKLEFRGWSVTTGSGESCPQLSDDAGNVLPLKSFEPGWEPPGKATHADLFPGKKAESLLIFEAPPGKLESLKLQLPGAAVGSAAEIRLLIPRSTVLHRTGPK